jgi:hypothetical protein
MQFPSYRYVLLSLLAALLLSACHDKDDVAQSGGSTPEAALQGSVDLLKAGDFNHLWKHALPPADYATMRADWSRQAQNRPPITAEDRVKFNETVQKLTAPDAEQKLYAEVRPKLTSMEQQYKDQLPVLISIGQALAKSRIAQNTNLTEEQKTQLNGALDVLGPWAQQTAWFDPAKTKQAIGVAVTTARKLDLKSLDQLRAMDFDATMAKYSTGFAGVRQLLAVYGLSIDDTLDSIKLTPLSSSKGHAVVKVDYTLLGKPLSTESKMVLQDGRWYAEDLLDNVRESHRRLGAQANASVSPGTPAAAGTAAAKD